MENPRHYESVGGFKMLKFQLLFFPWCLICFLKVKDGRVRPRIKELWNELACKGRFNGRNGQNL